MRIYWVKAGKLLPVDTGGKIRSFNLLKHLSRRHELTLLSAYGGPSRDADYERALAVEFPLAVPIYTGAAEGGTVSRVMEYTRSLLGGVPYTVGRFADGQVTRTVSEWDRSGRFDIGVCDFLAPSMNFPYETRTPTVLFQHNVESMLWHRQAAAEQHPVKRPIFALEASRMARYERAAVGRFEHVIAVSDADREAMLEMCPGARISVVPTGVDTAAFTPAARNTSPAPIVLFLGSMDWNPNIDAVQHFVQASWPRIRAAVPAARFHIVGRNPPPGVRQLASETILVSGRVPSVQEHLHAAAIVVVPLRSGGGTRLKIYEAMAAGKAVVSTSIGAEGLDVRDGHDVVIADAPETFADAVIRLLGDPGARRRIEDAAMATASRYDWSRVGDDFETVLRSVALGGDQLRRTEAVA